MKRIIAALLLSVSLLFVCSCEIDITEQFNQISQMVMDQAVGLVGPFLKEDEQFKNSVDTDTEIEEQLIEDALDTGR